jgi:succinate dehydrogenase / fumarate reductase membrane anchor subunit
MAQRSMSCKDAAAYYTRPFPSIVSITHLLVGFPAFQRGVQTLIEDYVHGFRRRR